MVKASSTAAAGLAGVILMLAAEPSDRGGLRLREEYRHVRQKLAERGLGSSIRQLAHVHLGTLAEILADHDDARILHFSGYIGGEGPRLLEPGMSGAPDASAVMAAFARIEHIDCVFLNVRHNRAQAERISRRVRWVVAMGESVEDQNAITFAGHFYSALADGARIDSAFRIALTRSKLPARGPTSEPVLYHYGDIVPQMSAPAQSLPTDAPRSPRDSDEFVKLLPITQVETELLVELIEARTGIALSVNPATFLQRRLSPRLETLGMSRFLEYCDYLVSGSAAADEERTELIEAITTHETYFFREQYQLDGLSELILPELLARPGFSRPLRIWSAGCSTGEEAYTLAILLLEQPAIGHDHVRVVGTDISPKVIEAARAAVYGENSFRTLPQELRRKYFVETDNRWTVHDHVREMCRFEVLNLLDTDRFAEFGKQDVISCRNVLMYLSTRARREAVDAFYESLTPGGYLLLGHSESLLNLKTRFELAHLQKDLVYRKPAYY